MSQFNNSQPWMPNAEAAKILQEFEGQKAHNPEEGEIVSGVAGYEDSKLMLTY